MAYCTRNDLYDALSEEKIKRYARDEQTDDDATLEARIDEAIDKASARIDGYLRARTELPLDPVPGIVRDLSIDVALYFLASRKGIARSGPDEILIKKYDDAIAYLKDIQSGKADIGIAAGENVSRPSAGATVSEKTRIFTDDFFRGF